MDLAEKLSELAQALSQASAAVGVLALSEMAPEELMALAEEEEEDEGGLRS